MLITSIVFLSCVEQRNSFKSFFTFSVAFSKSFKVFFIFEVTFPNFKCVSLKGELFLDTKY